MVVVGIDENGYGPKLGPLIATAVAVDVPDLESARLTGRERVVRDSKTVFKRTASSYAVGESTALEILFRAGRLPGTLRDLIDGFALLRYEALCERAGSSAREMMEKAGREIRLPVWSEPSDSFRADSLRELSERPIKGVAIALLFPRTFNEFVPGKGTKAYCDFMLFFDLAVYGPPADRYVFGKIGVLRYYTPFMLKYKIDRLALVPPWKAVREDRGESVYRFGDGREFRFVQDADALYAPVAMASLVGKYVRELFMLAENRYFGLDGPVPVASGYPGDPQTKRLHDLLSRRFPEAGTEWVRAR